MIKFRLYFDKDKEIVWLNKMAAKGYAMTGFFAGFYTFEKCEPGEYVYQVDFGDRFFKVSNDYREFMEETGIEIVQTWGFWVILRKKADEGAFELYTDVDSQIAHYTKIRNMFKIVAILDIICFMIEIICYEQVSAESKQLSFCCIILVGVIAAAITKAAFKTNQIVIELKERKGEGSHCMNRNNASRVLAAGIFLNSGALLIDNPSLHIFKMILHIFAIILMLVGIYRTSHGIKD